MKHTKAIIIFLLGTALSIHLVIIAFYHFPDNPLKHQYKLFTLSYINPFFSQEWKLFAPNPISSNTSLGYQFTFYKSGKIVKVSPILDVNKPIVDHKRNNFFSTDLRLLKFFSSCCLNVMVTRQEVSKEIFEDSATKADSMRYQKIVAIATEQSFGNKSIKEYGLFVLNNYYKKNNISYDSVRVQYQINSAIFPRFSKRNDDYYNVKNYTYTRFVSKPYTLFLTKN